MAVLAIWLLLWHLAVCPLSASGQSEAKVIPLEDGVKLTCTSATASFTSVGSADSKTTFPLKLDYKDENSGLLTCGLERIYVKFRTCENCVELDFTAVASVAVGNLMATVMIGVAVYHLALHFSSHSSSSSTKKDSGRQPLLQNDHNSHYQPLKPRVADEYNVLPKRR